MFKFLFVFLLASFNMAHGVENTGLLTAKAPKAPFLKINHSGKTNNFTPFFKENGIVCGNKRLQLFKDGKMKLYCDNQQLANIYMNFIINGKKKIWFKIGEKKYFESQKSGLQCSLDKIEYNGLIKNSAGSRIRQTITITPKGLVRVVIEFKSGESSSREIKTDSLMIEIPESYVNGEKIDANGKTYSVPALPKYGFFSLWRGKDCHLTLFKNSPAKRFAINTTENGVVLGWKTNRSLIIRLYSQKATHRLVFTIDMRKGIKYQQSKAVKHGGIDFKAVDDLCLPDQQASVNLMRNPSFDQGLSGYTTAANISYQTGPARWCSKPLKISQSVSKIGKTSLQLNLIKGEKYPFYTPPSVLSKGQYTFSFYIKGATSQNQELHISVPGTRWISGSPWSTLPGTRKSFKVTDNWTRHSLTFNVPGSMPVRILAYGSGNGSIWLDALQLEKGNKATKFVCAPFTGRLLSSSPNNVVNANKPFNAVLKITGTPNSQGTATIRVKDFFNEKLYSQTFEFKCGSDGLAELPLPFEHKFPLGSFVMRVNYKNSSGKKNYEFHRFTIMHYMNNDYRLKNIFADDYSALQTLFANLEERLRCWQQVGIGAKTHAGNWEKTAFDIYAKYNIKIFDAVMLTRMTENGKRYFSIRTQTGRSYDKIGKLLIKDFRLENPNEELTADYLKRFKQAVARNVRSYPWIRCWSFGGENGAAFPELAGLTASPSEFKKYVKLQQAFFEAVKETDPDCKVSNGAPCNMSPSSGIKLLDRLLCGLAGKIKYDYIGIHCYRATPENPDLDTDLQVLFKMLDKHGYGDTKVLLPEGLHYGPYQINDWGVNSSAWLPTGGCWYHGPLSFDVGWTEKVSAAFLARSWLVALKHQNRLRAVNGGLRASLFLDMQLTPGVIQKTINTLAHLLGDAEFIKEIKLAPYVRCYIFRDKGNRPVAAVWNYDPAVNAGRKNSYIASSPFESMPVEFFDQMECSKRCEADKNGVLNFPVSPFPFFLRGNAGSLSRFIAALENTIVNSGGMAQTLSIYGRAAGADKLSLFIQNFNKNKVDGNIRVDSKTYPLQMQGLSKFTETYPFPGLIASDRIENKVVPIKISAGQNNFTGKIISRGFLCLKSRQKITIDGNLDDWSNIPAIQLTDRWLADKKSKIDDENFSGYFKTAWDSTGLYLCVSIVDDKFVHTEYKQTGKRWKNDSLQLYFDALADAGKRESGGYDENDYEYAVFPNSTGNASVVYRYLQPDNQLTLGTAIPESNAIAKDIPSAFKRTHKGYIYEVFFPAKYLLPALMKANTTIGFGMFVNDMDKQNGRIKSALTLAGKGNGCFSKPHLYPTMVLSK
jgi:hypothetical protein